MSFEENQLTQKNISLIGVDEVGRGPLAGDVVCAGSFFKGPQKEMTSFVEFAKSVNLTDSKKLSAQKRINILAELGITISNLKSDHVYKINHFPIKFYIKTMTPDDIERLNILWASIEGMHICASKLAQNEISNLWFDGNRLPKIKKDNFKYEALTKGDSRSAMIALSSIVAKEFRDLQMKQLSKLYPHFGFETNFGYPTEKHRQALMTYGPCEIHRKSFKGVREYL